VHSPVAGAPSRWEEHSLREDERGVEDELLDRWEVELLPDLFELGKGEV